MTPHAPRCPRRRSRHRNGTTIVETAFVLGTCLFLLFGMLDLSVAIIRYNLLSEAARRIARAAIVHGSSASESQGTWGPMAFTTTAASDIPAAKVISDSLITLDPNDVLISLEWPDGDNQPDDRTRVTVGYTHKPIISLPGWYLQLELQGISTMRIAH